MTGLGCRPVAFGDAVNGGRSQRSASGLGAWLAELQVDDAIAARRREHWLRRQDAEAATWIGVLRDVAESGETVVAETSAATRHVGRLTAVGEEIVALRARDGTDVLVRTDRLTAARPDPTQLASPLVGDRPATVDSGWPEALAALSAERPQVKVVTDGGATASGVLWDVGLDVVTLRTEGRNPGLRYVSVRALVEVSLTGSG